MDSKLAADRCLGSAEDFEQDWAEAVAQGGGRWLIYPTARPATQFDMFEQIKAGQVDSILAMRELEQGLVLEYGCGAAGMAIYLANRGFHTIACDISANALRLAQLNAQSNLISGSNGQFDRVQADVLQLPFADESFDIVMSYGLLEHFHPYAIPVLLSEVCRTLRPGGLFIADIAHGRFSVQTIGMYLSLVGSLTFHALTLRWGELRSISHSYLNGLYENRLDEDAWVAAFRQAKLRDVSLRIFQPFPSLAVSGRLERGYVWLMKRLLPVGAWFHRTQPRWARHWAWLYLAWGTK